ncbi:MAG: MmcB family DNA repair protein [Roseinatronobacter sp.]
MNTPVPSVPLAPGLVLARGVVRGLCELGFAPLTELVPARGMRVDVMALGPKGELWIIECKSSRADFRADHKWQGYLNWCDRFFWAVGPDFPQDLLPEQTGLFLADGYGSELVRMAPEHPLAPARRKRIIQDFARHAALRLARSLDPGLI